MPSASLDFSPEPDLHPLYPSTSYIADLLSSNSGLAPTQRSELVAHCLTRACVFGELGVLQYLLSDPQAQPHVDLGMRDEDGLGLVSLTILGFGADSDRDIEREECVRLLIAQGAELRADKDSWTPLHHAALLSPPTLVSHLLTHGCSPFAVTYRNLKPLDIVTAHSILPGRGDVALLLEEAMRGQGWTGGRMEQKRRIFEKHLKQEKRQQKVHDTINEVLGIQPTWWRSDSESMSSDSQSDDEDSDDSIYTPAPDYSSMLVFSPVSLPHIFDSLITNFQPSFRNSTPANILYLLARFACLTCDHTWLEDLIIGATDAIEETFFSRADDVTCLIFWLYNMTVWLHLLKCDNSINEACEMLGSFDLIEEVINSVFVFIIRFAERRIDQLFDVALLDFSPLASEFESIQFESDWSFLRPFTTKKRVISSVSYGSTLSRAGAPSPPSSGPSLPPSQSHGTLPSSTSSRFSSLRQSFIRSRGPTPPLSSLFTDSPPSPADLTSFLTALDTLLTLSDVNPALTVQLWSQVMYWTSCELFNRIITRKKYICRSRAIQIGMNLAVLEEWVQQTGLPPGIQSHFLPVRDLLNWLQSLSSITEFSELVATIQTIKSINPLQMRRAIRDYRYEVNEGRMTDECFQYLTQVQKDWERHRVKLGVEAIRKEMDDRELGGSISPYVDKMSGQAAKKTSIYTNSFETSAARSSIDMLFGMPEEILAWEPARPPQSLGELLDSRHMLPLLLPSDPRMLTALPAKFPLSEGGKREKQRGGLSVPDGQTSSLSGLIRNGKSWRLRNGKLRDVGMETLQWVDGIRSSARWARPVGLDDDEERDPGSYLTDYQNDEGELRVNVHVTPLTRKPSGRNKSRLSAGDTTTVELS